MRRRSFLKLLAWSPLVAVFPSLAKSAIAASSHPVEWPIIPQNPFDMELAMLRDEVRAPLRVADLKELEEIMRVARLNGSPVAWFPNARADSAFTEWGFRPDRTQPTWEDVFGVEPEPSYPGPVRLTTIDEVLRLPPDGWVR